VGQRIPEKEIANFQFGELRKSEFVERFPELSLFFKAFSLLNSEMICIFPYFCPCEIIVREIREISFSHCLPPCREALLNHA
jgi:SPX domain protein involved in polyphosphate accumulation